MRIHKDLPLLLLLVAMLLFGYSFLKSTYPGFVNPNILSRVYLAMAIAEEHSFTIDTYIARFGDIQDKGVYKGHAYSDKPPGYALFISPIAGLVNKVCPPEYSIQQRVERIRFFCLTVPSIVFWLFAFTVLTVSMGIHRHFAFAAILAAAFGTNFIIYTNSLFSHAPAGMLLFASLVLSNLGVRPLFSSHNSHAAGFVSGFLLACSLTFDYILLPAIILTGLLTIYRRWSDRRWVLWFGFGFCIPITGLMCYNTVCFDAPWRTGFHVHADPQYGASYRGGFFGIQLPSPLSIPGMLILPQRGMLFYSPMLLFSLIGVEKIGKKDTLRPFRTLLLTALVSIFLFATTTVDWRAGWSVASRYLVSTIPLLMPGIALFLQNKKPSGLSFRLLGGFALAGFFHAGITMLTFHAFPPCFINPLYNFCIYLLRDGFVTRSLFGLPSAVTIPMWYLFMGGVGLFFLLMLCREMTPKLKAKTMCYSFLIFLAYVLFGFTIGEPESLKMIQIDVFRMIVTMMGY